MMEEINRKKEENVVFPTNRETREKFEEVILGEYKKKIESNEE